MSDSDATPSILPDAETARALGCVPDDEARTLDLWPRPETAPAARVGLVDWWDARDLEPLASRRGWKHQGRRVRPNVVPRCIVRRDGQSVRLFGESQTWANDEHAKAKRAHIEARLETWSGRMNRLQADLAEWAATLDDAPGPDAEIALALLMQRRRKLDRSLRGIADSIRALGDTPPVIAEVQWHDAVTRYRARCFELVSSEEFVVDAALAREVHRQVISNIAGRARHDPLMVPPFWQYFGRFQKLYQRLLYEREVASATRIREFHTLFPARRMKRKITLYLGPTNSGKTFRALKRLSAAQAGVYLAPLRLLALEISETLVEWGVPCDMITGEERIQVPGAAHVASTIEMLDLSAHHGLCVIDEAQMLGDADRGWAWTQAILGVMAEEVCIVGAPEAEPAIARLLELTGEPYEVVRTERLTPLAFLRKPVMHFSALEPGTALVAFSRASVLKLKSELETETGSRVAVVYGALPPEVRRLQARLFASGEAPFLVATDAIGMGLNLPIRTILFTQDEKFYDRQSHPITPMEARQIGGRAGRFGQNEAGWLGTFRCPVARVREAWETPPSTIDRAHLAPVIEHLEAISEVDGDRQQRLAQLLALFIRTVKPDPHYYRLADLEDQMVLARIADARPRLALGTRFALSGAPVTLRNTHAVNAFQRMVDTVALNTELELDTLIGDGIYDARGQLATLESEMQVVNLYCWVHYRFPKAFPDLARAERRRRRITTDIDAILSHHLHTKPWRRRQEAPENAPRDKHGRRRERYRGRRRWR